MGSTIVQLRESFPSVGSTSERPHARRPRQNTLAPLTPLAANGDFAHFVAGSRTDRNYALNVRLDYRLMPRIVVYGGYDLDNRSSQAVIDGQSFDGEFDYDKNTVYVGLQASY